VERLLSEQFIGMVGPTFKASAHAWSILTVRRWSFKPFASPIFAIASATRSSAFCIYCVVAASSIHATSRSTTTPCRTRLGPTSPSRPSTASSSSDGYQSPPMLRSGGCRRGSPPRVRRLATSSRSWNPNSIQQMVAFEAPCEGYLGMGARQQGGDILLPTPCFIRRLAQPIVTGILPSFRTTPSTCC
jgi:hypothetical protein